jgi:hypothetical protein
MIMIYGIKLILVNCVELDRETVDLLAILVFGLALTNKECQVLVQSSYAIKVQTYLILANLAKRGIGNGVVI